MKLISMECPSCKANLELDIDNLIAYCPYCGKKLLFDLDQMQNIIAEKEKTKQIKLIQDHQLEKLKLQKEIDKNDSRETIAILLLHFLGPIIAIALGIFLFWIIGKIIF